MASKRFFQFRTLPALAAAALLAAAISPAVQAGASGPNRPSDTRRFYPDDPLWQDDDRRDIPPVARRELSDSYDFLENTFGSPAQSFGSALNMNTLGEVPDSSWFTNRIGVGDMTLDQLRRGPNTVDGPAPGAWEVIGRPGTGITPKFTIRDANGVTFLIKLDPPDVPELASSVEVISTKIFHAIGYNVPEDYIAALDPAKLSVSPKATMKTETGGKRRLELDDVQRWLQNQPRAADGTIRVLASRWLPGKVVGNFRFAGTRSDDANDIYPHERRRELRGLRAFAAWLNHDDARSLNTLDSYVEENGRRYLRHYLQDFGSTLGSGSTAAQQPRAGHEYLIEGDKIGKGLVSFGLWQRKWMTAEFPRHASLGNIEADVFEPESWKTEYPHASFDQMDAVDGFWAARIASRFTDKMIASIVETARLSNADAAAHLASIISRRRDKVVAHWIRGTNPVDNFAVEHDDSQVDLTFDNAAHRLGFAAPAARYQLRWATLDNMSGVERFVGPAAEQAATSVNVPEAAWGPRDPSGFRYAIVSIRTIQAGYAHWAQPVKVTLRERGENFDVVAIDRPSNASAKAPRSETER